MPEDWAQATAKKVESRLSEEAERVALQRKRFDEGVQRFRKQLLDLVGSVNAHIDSEAGRLHVIVLDNGTILSAAYKRIVTVEELGAVAGVPACVGRIVVEHENRRGPVPEAVEIYVTAAGTQTAFYQRVGGKDLKPLVEADFKRLIEYFAS
jgi:hypothetical protein